MKFLILQEKTNYVYAFCHNAVAANTVAQSVPGAFVMGITSKTFGKTVFAEIQQKDYLSLNTYKLNSNYKKLLLVPIDEVPTAWADTQSIIAKRIALMGALNIWYSQATVSTDRYHWDGFLQYVARDVAKSDLVNNKFGPRIQQYAQTLGMSDADAYTKLRDEVLAHYQYQFNLSVLLEKYKARIITVTTENQAIQVKQNLQRDLLEFCKDKINSTINGNKLLSKDVNDFVFS